MCSGIETPEGNILYKRIHAKIFVVDDRFFMVSSSNINKSI
ncbi:MAG: hypothetical protein EOP48_19115 [Sphingobacteriales bacterium]|nr:MAG: hypothetical protein EOP48_19115 [Sphingobacteriales bacterium]